MLWRSLRADQTYVPRLGAPSIYARTELILLNLAFALIRENTDRFSDRNMLLRSPLLFGFTFLQDPQNTIHLYEWSQR